LRIYKFIVDEELKFPRKKTNNIREHFWEYLWNLLNFLEEVAEFGQDDIIEIIGILEGFLEFLGILPKFYGIFGLLSMLTVHSGISGFFFEKLGFLSNFLDFLKIFLEFWKSF
jgi:hypothetical protein